MKRGLLLNVVVREGASILQLFTGKNQTLLVGWDTLLVLNLGFHVVDGVLRLDLQRNGLPGESLDKDLRTATETENEMQSGFLLDVVVEEGPTILKLFAGKNETLLSSSVIRNKKEKNVASEGRVQQPIRPRRSSSSPFCCRRW